MKLPGLHSKCQNLQMSTAATLWRIRLPLLALVVVALTMAGFFHVRASQVVASHCFQDELQIQLSVNGFIPSEVQHAAGTFAIAVENSNIEGEYTLRLKAADGTVVKEVQIQKGSAAWTVTLTAGEYTLTEASHPQWQCRITVE
jgi:hypothetical protein